ncbi:MAG: hypothetical protein ACQERK_02775 [Campylobacterota bacterium]
MDNCSKIKAHVRMEERYAGMSLVCGCEEAIQKEIIEAIEKVSKELDLQPNVFDNPNKDYPEKEGFYIEFDDDYDRSAGKYFEKLLRELKIDKCEQ